MIRKPLNQLQITAQASSFLAELAEECRMAIQKEKEFNSLSEQIRAADYMASVFNAKLHNTRDIPDAVNYHQCMNQCVKHANELKAQLQAILDAETQRKQYIRQSV